jgi:hypothetical protein
MDVFWIDGCIIDDGWMDVHLASVWDIGRTLFM